MNNNNETLEEKYNRFMKAINEYGVRIDKMLANPRATPLEDLHQVLKELKEMRDEAQRVEDEILILHKLMGEKNG